MRIATWNINSVRIRLPLLERLVREEAPDIVCLQETKVIDELFPRDEIGALGSPHLAISGKQGYNGVAILSQVPFAQHPTRDWCERRSEGRRVGQEGGRTGRSRGSPYH